MNVLDLIAVAVIFGLGLSGFRRGFTIEVIETVGVLAAAIGSYLLYPSLVEWLGSDAELSWGTRILIFAGSFVAIMIVITVIGHLLKRFLKAIRLGQFDKLLGFVLGGIKGGLLVAAIATAVIWVAPSGEKHIRGSKIIRADLLAMDMISNALPKPVQDKYRHIIGVEFSSLEHSDDSPVRNLIPIQYIDSLGDFSLHKSRLAIRTMLESLNNQTKSQGRIPGFVTDWDAENLRGQVEYSYMDSVHNLPIFPGSIHDSLAELDLIKKPISFVPAYSELLRCIYAEDVQLEPAGN